MSITPLMPVYPRCGVRPVRGEHCHLIDEDGTRYLDFASGIAVNLLGHSHEGLIGAIQQQAATLMHVSNLYGSPQGEKLAQTHPLLRANLLTVQPEPVILLFNSLQESTPTQFTFHFLL